MSPLLYQIHCIGPVGFGFAHIYSETCPPNRDPTICAFCGKNLYASENDNRTRQGQTPQEGTMMDNLLGRKWRTAKRSPTQQASGATCVALAPNRARTTREPHRRPPLDPDGGRWLPHKTLSRGSAAGTVFRDRCWCLLTHSSNRMGL